MPFQLKKVDALAEELGKSVPDTLKFLAQHYVPHRGGFFDQGALDSVMAEPKLTNIKTKTKNSFTLSPTDGLGAMKHVLDGANLDITRHLTRRANFLTVRNARGHRTQIKVYTTQRTHGEYDTATFSMRGFLAESDAVRYFMFICYEGPIAWVLSRKQLLALYTKVQKSPTSSDICRIPKLHAAHPTGAITLYLDPGQEAYLLTKASQLGL